MAEPAQLTRTIVEAHYCEALVLADEARAAFALAAHPAAAAAAGSDDLDRVTLSCEALRTTTRMMHAVAWLLNRRAYFAGELGELHLRRHAPIPAGQGGADLAALARLDPGLAELAERCGDFCARIERLDAAWHESEANRPASIHAMRERLSQAVAAL